MEQEWYLHYCHYSLCCCHEAWLFREFPGRRGNLFCLQCQLCGALTGMPQSWLIVGDEP